MKKKSTIAGIIVVLLVIGVFFAYNSGVFFKKETATQDIQLSAEKYLEKVDTAYSFELAKKLTTFKSNEKLGFRPAGSIAELAAGEMLVDEFKTIGLKNVTKDEISVDAWEFEKADLSYIDKDNQKQDLVLGAYQTNFVTNGPETFEIIYAGKGTKDDLENLDVTDKLVLIDINQREEWWINYPAYQAKLKGAKAVIAAQKGGYGEIDPTALNAQDMCGPDDTPAFSISRKDADAILATMQATGQQTLQVTFDAKSVVTKDSKSYNIVGEIPGKDPNSIIVLSAHYDAYFDGFQDDAAAIGLIAGIAKGLIDSEYQPEKTIVFVAQAAEEWGVSNSRYDWSKGAYEQVFKARPEWQNKVVANFNFEMPAYEHASASEVRSVYELNRFLTEFAPSVPTIEGVYKDGISVISPLRTWSDDYSYSLGGVPAVRNDFKSSEFSKNYYHSQFDNESTYNELAFRFHHNLYGLLVLAYDQTAVMPLDFTKRFEAMKESLNADVTTVAGVDTQELVTALDQTIAAAQKLTDKVYQINAEYRQALLDGDAKKANKILKENQAFNEKLREAYRYAQDQLVKLTWEDVQIFPHEHAQTNLDNINKSIDALTQGDVKTPIDEYLWAVDNNWYAYDFDKTTFDFFTNQTLEQGADRLNWGTGRIMGHEDLYDVINSLLPKYDVENPEVSTEIQALQAAKSNQENLLKVTIDQEKNDVRAIEAKLSELIK